MGGWVAFVRSELLGLSLSCAPPTPTTMFHNSKVFIFLITRLRLSGCLGGVWNARGMATFRSTPPPPRLRVKRKTCFWYPWDHCGVGCRDDISF